MERYQILSENKFIPYEKMRALYKAESEWVKERDKMHKDTGEAWEKYENSDTMVSELNIKIKQILGTENGTWYTNIRDCSSEHLTIWTNMELHTKMPLP